MVRVGCCGFPVSRERYFTAFGVVELQQTFYQPPEDKTAIRWRREAPPGFEYALKAWQLITHESGSPTYRKLKLEILPGHEKNYGSFKPTDEVLAAWERTRRIAGLLEARIIIFQCPSSFGPSPENKRNLKHFFSSIARGGMIFAWEPRGKWEEGEIRPICEDLDLVHCVDPFKARSCSGDFGYYRLHGITGYRYRYTKEDLTRLGRIADGRRETYIMFNNIWMFDDARAFCRLIGAGGRRLKSV